MSIPFKAAILVQLVVLFCSIRVFAIDAQLVLQDENAAVGDHLGEYGSVFSFDQQHVVSCAMSYNSNQGKCIVFSETNPGDQDWGSTKQAELIDVNGVTNDKLGEYNSPVFSSDAQHVLVCARNYNSQQGKCVVFSETNLGDHDWGATKQIELIESGTAESNWLGRSGAVFSFDDQHILSCGSYWNSLQGKCMVFSETNLGDHNWGVTEQVELIDDNAANMDRLGEYGQVFSADAQHILVCTRRFSSSQGKCVVFSESNPGDHDWNAHQLELIDINGVASDWLGYRGNTFSNNIEHIVACAYVYNGQQGKCVVFSETNPGDHDWGNSSNTQLELIDDAYTSGNDNLGSSGAVFSHDDQSILVCASGYNDKRGKCIVFSESSIGSQDWNSNQVELLETVIGAKGSLLGSEGASFSANSQHIVTCAYGKDANEGGCYIFSASAVDAKDWALLETVLENPTGAGGYYYYNGASDWYTSGGDKLGVSGATFSPDSLHITACEYNTGDCFVFTPDVLADECASSPCLWDGNCTDLLYGFVCSCPRGTTGELCELDVDDCVSDPCFNDAVCTDDGSELNSFNCSCQEGYRGVLCDEDVDDCSPVDPCATTGVCSDDGSIPNSFNCTCDSGFNGTLCDEDYDDCVVSQCVFGVCSDDGSVPNSFDCNCDEGFTGVVCDEDIDDCLSSPCAHGAACIDDGSIVNSFNCSCLPGYTGSYCEVDIDDCVSNSCHAEGTTECVDLGADLYECRCSTFYSGDYCEIGPPCSFEPCQNNATCSNVSSTEFSCECLTGTTGSLCETDMDECASSPCYAAGTSSCTDLGINLFECKCLSDWSGVYCEVSEYVFEVTFALDDDVTSEEYAEQLELDLLSQFPDFQIDLLVVTDGNGVATFQITFWSNDDLEVPDEQELDIAFASAGYSGDLVDASYRSGDPEESGELGGVLTSRSSFFIAAGTTVTAVLLQ